MWLWPVVEEISLPAFITSAECAKQVASSGHQIQACTAHPIPILYKGPWADSKIENVTVADITYRAAVKYHGQYHNGATNR